MAIQMLDTFVNSSSRTLISCNGVQYKGIVRIVPILCLLSRGINVKHFYSGVVQVQDPSGMDLLKLTCKQKENWTVEKVSHMFTVLSFNSNHNL